MSQINFQLLVFLPPPTFYSLVQVFVVQVRTVFAKLTGSVVSAWTRMSSLATLSIALEDATDFFLMTVTAILTEFTKSELVESALHGCHFQSLVSSV